MDNALKGVFISIKIIGFAIGLVIILSICLVILGLLVISLSYMAGYIFDSIFRKRLIKIGQWIIAKFPEIKENARCRKVWKRIQLQDMYLRYETPLIAYCFSCTGIVMFGGIFGLVLPVDEWQAIIIATVVYVIFYFVGMKRIYGCNEERYDAVLKNNIEFLKLSFLPLGFIITVLGFAFTVGNVDWEKDMYPTLFNMISEFWNWFRSIMDANTNNITYLLLQEILLGIVMIVTFYVVSLPLQVIAYFIIMAIQYFRKYRLPYQKLVKEFRDRITNIIAEVI